VQKYSLDISTDSYWGVDSLSCCYMWICGREELYFFFVSVYFYDLNERENVTMYSYIYICVVGIPGRVSYVIFIFVFVCVGSFFK